MARMEISPKQHFASEGGDELDNSRLKNQHKTN